MRHKYKYTIELQKEKMIKMVAEKFNGKSEGISFENFKTFYNVLFGGADLERAMFFLDNKNNGVKFIIKLILIIKITMTII